MKRTLTIIMIIAMLLSLALPLAYAWQIERPYRTQIINGLVENNNTEDAVSVGLGINVNQYNEGPFNFYSAMITELAHTLWKQ
ncbi:MAG: hypothetical protein OEX01_02205 [Candidatus Bathyarchaeota archaeon]|nr:hypothetical protein [Candidatus Bathyarchaeota archaeon]